MSTTTTPDTPVKTFADFGVEQSICDSLAEVGILSPFPIQEMTLPMALKGADIIGQARTGTGKTLGFGLPLIQRIDTARGLQALVIVPTRELCLQVSEDLAQAGRGRGVDVLAVYGGKAIQPQIDAIADGAHLVVGTPGRLLDLVRRGFLDLSAVAGLVLDEADEMLDLGFLPDVEALIEQCSSDRQTLLFSATMPAAIVGLARRYMSKPTFMRADVEEINIAPKTKQYFFSCHRMDKPAVVARILQAPNRGLCVIFCRTKRMADILAEELRDRDVAAQAIHSDLRQDARERVLQKFRDGKVTVLCATEVAARGLDIDDVSHVVNYDCPDDEKMYLHRIGRTGRAGANGVAITFAVWNELPRLEMIRRELGIEDEVHEVFSTSPLLDELFDLPAREERKKVPSTPQARSGTSSKERTGEGEKRGRRSGGRGGRKDEGSASGSRTGGDADDTMDEGGRASGRRKARPTASETASASDGDDGVVRTRRRTRTRGEGGDDAGDRGGRGGRGGRDGRTGAGRDGDGDEPGAEATASESMASESAVDTGRTSTRRARSSEDEGGAETGRAPERADRSSEDEGGTTRRRRRSRGGRGTADRDPQSEESTSSNRSSDRSGARSSEEEESSGDRTRPRGRSRTEVAARDGRDRPSRTDGVSDRGNDDDGGDDAAGGGARSERRGGRDGGRGRGEGRGEGRARRDEDGGRGRTDGRGDGRGDGRKDDSRGESRRKDDGGGDGRGQGRSSGRGSRSSRGRSSGGGGRDGRDGRGSQEGRDGRGGRGGQSRRPAVDHTEARGDGSPRLTRKLEVEHLP